MSSQAKFFIINSKKLVEVSIDYTCRRHYSVSNELNGLKLLVNPKDILTLSSEQQESLVPEAFQLLWDRDRSVEENLVDCCRYYQQQVPNFKPPYSFWVQVLFDLRISFSKEQVSNAWNKAFKVEYKIQNPTKEDKTFYYQGRLLKLSLHAKNRLYQRFTVHKENFNTLISQVLDECLAVIPPKGEVEEGTLFFYHKDYHLAFVLKNKDEDSLTIVTVYEPNMKWRSAPVNSEFYNLPKTA